MRSILSIELNLQQIRLEYGMQLTVKTLNMNYDQKE